MIVVLNPVFVSHLISVSC